MSTGEHDPESPVSTAVDSEENENLASSAEGEVEGESEGEPKPEKLDLDVQVTSVGPCRKHVTVAIAQSEVTKQFQESLKSMKRDAFVPGFRPGHAPRSLVERRYKKEVADQVKSTLIMAALQQLEADHKLNPISQPQLDLAAIPMPDDGPLKFELELEVRPEFPLPAYKALTVNRPVKTLTDEDVDTQLTLFLERHAQLVPKLEGGAEIGDFLTADLTFTREGQVYNEVKEIQFRLQPELRFQDGSIPEVGKVLTGVKPGESRTAEARIGSGSADPSLRGQTIQMNFLVHDLKMVRLPEVTPAFLSSIGFDNLNELREALREILERRLLAQQRQAVRREIMDKLIDQTPFDLPADLVARQESSTIRRLVMEMKQDGFSETEIRAREAAIRTNAKESTQRGLKEFFILAEVADAEGIKVEEDDFEHELESLAARTDETPRRVRARVEKEGLADALASQILERKTLTRILDYVSYVEVPLDEQDQEAIETLDQSATFAPPAAEVEGEGGGEGATDSTNPGTQASASQSESESQNKGSSTTESGSPGASEPAE